MKCWNCGIANISAGCSDGTNQRPWCELCLERLEPEAFSHLADAMKVAQKYLDDKNAN